MRREARVGPRRSFADVAARRVFARGRLPPIQDRRNLGVPPPMSDWPAGARAGAGSGRARRRRLLGRRFALGGGLFLSRPSWRLSSPPSSPPTLLFSSSCALVPPFSSLDFFFAFDFFAMIVLPIDAANKENLVGPHWRPGSRHNTTEPPSSPRPQNGRIAERGQCSRSAGGHGPPVAQSINSTVWTAGSSCPRRSESCSQYFLPRSHQVAILSIVPTLRSRNLLAISGCRIL